jgi:hypothetical protein
LAPPGEAMRVPRPAAGIITTTFMRAVSIRAGGWEFNHATFFTGSFSYHWKRWSGSRSLKKMPPMPVTRLKRSSVPLRDLV